MQRANEIDKKVGANLRSIRLMRKLTQEELGTDCGLSFQQIQKYENASNRIGASRLHQLSIVLDVPLQAFFDGIEAIDAGPISIEYAALTRFVKSDEGRRLNEAFATLPRSTQKLTIKLVNEIVRTQK